MTPFILKVDKITETESRVVAVRALGAGKETGTYCLVSTGSAVQGEEFQR